MQATINNPVATTDTRAACRMYNCVGLVALILLCAAVLFANLGAAALFEPDEGRNAEKAREILLLHDWVTPHENFLAVLDKPMPYLPSALAGAGCVVLVFLFARRFFGLWPALWSSLILLSSLEFYLFSRIVIFDITLTFFMTLSLFCFFAALHEEDRWLRRSIFFFMYFGFAAATLVKGPIGVVLPGFVALAYLIIARKLSWLRRLDLPLGIVLFFAIVAPWYYLVEISNPGYSRYFLWEENFIRYLTPHFNRTQGWYYFFYVLAVGFFPWTICVPAVIKQAWRKRDDDTVLLVSLWVVLLYSADLSALGHIVRRDDRAKSNRRSVEA
ncbi:MAG: glycosyltransferase family 39 protein [Deltaproteobacteria bacterium]|nr:MAG: glycosyltransferase family 39 protein [Deltaproteobacteria bacterium]